MKRQSIDQNWEFSLGKPSMIPGFPSEKRIVNLPHDYLIESEVSEAAPGGSSTGFYGGGCGSYVKFLDINETYADKKAYVEFDGSYGDTTVYLNGNLVTRHYYGYSPFHADITPFLKIGAMNKLLVVVDNDAQANARWYSGAGLYRHVDLLSSHKSHIAPWGIFARTSHIINGTAFVSVETTVENGEAEDKCFWVELYAKKCEMLTNSQKRMLPHKANKQAEQENYSDLRICGRVKVFVPAGKSAIARENIQIKDAALWDVESPNLYNISAVLKNEDGCPIDAECARFGVRTITVDTENGFMLNGRTIKLKGGCVHHDNGILGAASFYDSEYRRCKLHKDNGYNALRFAHNPMSRDMLQVCDELGLLVINEAFDVWTMSKSSQDYTMHFKDDWQASIEAFVKRDRNCPCVALWSTGNEVAERGGLSNGYQWAAKLADEVRSLDPSRPLIHSICSFFSGLDDEMQQKFYYSLMEDSQKSGNAAGGLINLDSTFGREIWGPLTEAFVSPVDVVGYNYLIYHYAKNDNYPNRIICGTECKPMQMAAYWEEVIKNTHVIGDFAWTSYDYIGEAGLGRAEYVEPDEAINAARSLYFVPYPWRTANDADFDLCGVERPQLAYRRIVWGSDETYIASGNPANYGKTEVLGNWGWPIREHDWTWPCKNGDLVYVDVYSRADEVELFLNGNSLGRKAANMTIAYRVRFEVPYTPGELKAISYVDGKEVSADTVFTTGLVCDFRLTTEETQLAADGQSLAFITVELIDKDGNKVFTSDYQAKASVDGAASLAAFGTGRPITEGNYTTGEFASYKGYLMAIVRSGYESGTATITVRVEGLGEKNIEIEIL